MDGHVIEALGKTWIKLREGKAVEVEESREVLSPI